MLSRCISWMTPTGAEPPPGGGMPLLTCPPAALGRALLAPSALAPQRYRCAGSAAAPLPLPDTPEPPRTSAQSGSPRCARRPRAGRLVSPGAAPCSGCAPRATPLLPAGSAPRAVYSDHRSRSAPRLRPIAASGNANLKTRPPMAMLDRLLEGLARPEGRNLPGRDPHRLPGLGIFALSGLLIADVELAEARDLDLLARLECSRYGRRESFQVLLGFALGRVGVLDHLLDQLLLVHACCTPPRFPFVVWTFLSPSWSYPRPETTQT